MYFRTTQGAFLIIVISLLGYFVDGHNYLVNPVSRANQRDTQTGCRFGGEGNPTCAGPCDRKLSQTTRAPISIQRGQTIEVEWNRHNHPGGFIRFAWSPTSQSDYHASFDSYVDHFVCKDAGGCGPANPSSPTGEPNGLNCGASITVPTWLTNGAWTLQWAYFGGYYNAGDYYACVDYTITGGSSGTQQAAYFNGGDFTYPNQQKCLFYTTNALHVCSAEPCMNGTFPLGVAQAGAPLGVGAPITPPAPATTHAPATTRAATTRAVTTRAATTHAVQPPTPLTTHAAAPATTHAPAPVAPATTHAPAPVAPATTHAPAPATTRAATTRAATTHAPVPVTPATTHAAPVPPPSNQGGNCAGYTGTSSSQAVMIEIDTWGTTFRATIEIHVQESVLNNWRLKVVFPSNQVDPAVTSAVNAGVLSCQSNYPVPHAIIRPTSWALEGYSGDTITVEIFGTNKAGFSGDYIISHTSLYVLTQ